MKPRPDLGSLRERVLLLAVFAALIPLGYWLRFKAPLPPELRDGSGGALYVALWMALAAAIFTRASPWRIATAVTLATCVLEFLQLWHPGWLEVLRATFLGRVVLGTTFGWSDFPPYFIGGLVGWLFITRIRKAISAEAQRRSSGPVQ